MDSRNASGCAARNASTDPSFSAANTEQVAYSRSPPGTNSGQRAARSRCCCWREAGEVGLAPQPLPVRMPADDARGRARDVGQDAVEWLPVPPRGRIAGVARDDAHLRSLESQPSHVGVDTLQPRLVAVERRQRKLRAFQQMRGLASRRRAGVQDPHAVDRLQQRRCPLGPGVLHGESPFRVARQRGHRLRTGDDDAVGADRGRRDARGGEPLAAARRASSCRRLTRNVSGGRALPAARIASQSWRMVGLQAPDPPARIRPARDRARGGHLRVQRVAFAQVPAQERVDQRLRLRPGNECRRVDRAIDDGEGRRVGMVELIQRDRHERPQRRIERLRGKRPDQRLEAPPETQGAVGQFLHQRVAARGGRRPPPRARPEASRPPTRAARPAWLAVVRAASWPATAAARRSERPHSARVPPQKPLAGMRLPAAGCTTNRRSVPCPHATSMPSAPTPSTIPGAARIAAGPAGPSGDADPDGNRLPDLDVVRAEARERTRHRVHRSNQAIHVLRGPRPVDRRVGPADLVGVGDAGGRLRRGCERSLLPRGAAASTRSHAHPPRPACRAACRRSRAARSARRPRRPSVPCPGRRPSA